MGCYIYEAVFETSLKIIVSYCSKKNVPLMRLSPQSSPATQSGELTILISVITAIKTKAEGDFKGLSDGQK